MNQELVRAQPAGGGAVVTADHYRDDYLEKLKVLKDVIAPGTTDFLIITLDTTRQSGMNHRTYIWLVDTHAEGNGGDDHL